MVCMHHRLGMGIPCISPPYAQTEGGGEYCEAMVGLWALFGTGRVSKRGTEVLRIAFLALIRDEGVTIAGDKAP